VTALPPSLIRFDSQLEHAIRRYRRRRQRTRFLRSAVVFAAIAAVTLGVLSTVPGSGPSVVERAAAAIGASDGSIRHVVAVTTGTNPDGRAVTWRMESWQQTVSPFNERQIVIAGNRRLEVATVDGVPQLYDAATNTIFTTPPQTSTDVPPTKDSAPAKARGEVEQLDGGVDRYRAKILALLQSGKVREDGRVTVDGRDAIRIVSTAADVILLVDAGTYEPIEWRLGGSTTRFPAYEHLAASDANEALLSLRAQHPDATVDADPGNYQAAQERLGPEGLKASLDSK
jgi:hypothetical protein